MKPTRKPLSILLTCLALTGVVAGVNQLWGCKGDRLPSEVNGAVMPTSSAERNAAFAAQEAENAGAEPDADDYYESEAEKAAELAITPFENLEQPAELNAHDEFILFKSQFIM